MATHTEGWDCHHCGGYGHITYDTRPVEEVPPVYGACEVCGYNFGCGEENDFTHPDSYEYLDSLHNLNVQRFWNLEVDSTGKTRDDEEWIPYTPEMYSKIIRKAGLERLIEINVWRLRQDKYSNKFRSADDFFSDDVCRVRDPKRESHWCVYCKFKDSLYSSPFMNWISNPFEVK